MGRTEIFVASTDEPNEVDSELIELLVATCGRWAGCEWVTSYGPKKLNLHGLRSRQAWRLSDYTSDEESICWARAAEYLEQVERDAAEAEKAAKLAVSLLIHGCESQALEAIDSAVTIEAGYREPVVWRPLHDAVRAQIARREKLLAGR